MNDALHDVLRRRSALLARSEGLRGGLATHATVLVAPLALADRALTVGRWFVERPLVLGGIVAVVAVLRPRRTLVWAGRAWAGWRLLRRLQSP